MADPAIIIGFATAGLKLSFTLYAFAAAIGSAGKEMRQSARDISLFSSVLKQLGNKMDEAHKAGFVANEAFDLTKEIIAECRSVFDELETMIDKATTTEKITVIKMDEDDFKVKEVNRDKMTVSFGRRLLYLFQKAEILDQRNRLESLKTSLQVMLALITFTERVRSFKADERNGPAEYETWASEEKLELESLILANQATTSDFRKLKTKPSLNENTGPEKDKIAKFGVIGELPSLKAVGTTPSQGISGHRTRGIDSTLIPELDSTLLSAPPKFKSFLGTSKSSNESESEFVVMPPALSYTSSGGIAPYQGTSRTNPPATLGGGSQQPQRPTAEAKASKQSSTTHTSTPSAVVDMLVTQMMTEKGQRAMKLGKAGTQESASTIEDEDEVLIDLFSIRVPRPY